jgi:glycosyltransferase involved in cell wall biosynthesis
LPSNGIYGWSYQSGGVHFHRVAEPLRVAASHGIDAITGQQLDDEVADRYGTILAHMLWDERASQAWETLARRGQHRLVLDVDDLMWAPDFSPFSKHWTADVIERLFRNIRIAHVVTVPSAYLAEQIAPLNPNVWIVPNTVPEYLLKIDNPRPWPDAAGYRKTLQQQRYVIGYQGSPSHSPDFPPWLMRELHQALTLLDLSWTYHFWGPDDITGWPAHRCGHTPWLPMVDYHRKVSMDIGLGPLRDTPFNRAKSGLRAVEYAALGIPAILSDTEEYRRYVTPDTGILLRKGQSWRDAILKLAEQPIARAGMAQAARDRATAWTTEASIGVWAEAWNSVTV